MERKYTLDQESLKKLGVPEKFENIFDNVFKDADCNIYVAKGDKMHLLAKNARAYRISREEVQLPDNIAGMQKQYFPSTNGEKLLQAVKELRDFWDLNFVLVTEGIYTREMKVFARSATDATEYGELPEWDYAYIGGMSKLLIAGALPMIADKDCFKIIDFVPLFETAFGNMIFWAGANELFEVCSHRERLTFRYFGQIEGLVQTRVSHLLKIRKANEQVLYHISKTLNCLGASLLQSNNAFEIDKTTGKVVVHSALCVGSVHDITSTYVFEGGRYIRV